MLPERLVYLLGVRDALQCGQTFSGGGTLLQSRQVGQEKCPDRKHDQESEQEEEGYSDARLRIRI
jgi:hypothetical protein